MPIAKPDSARTLRGTPVVIAVLANDEGTDLALAGYTQPPFGSLALNADRSFTYTPATDFEGVDGFAYTVRDRLGVTAQGEVQIVVARPNTTPEPQGDGAAAMAGGAGVDIPVLANDNDSEGDPLAIIGIDAPAHGTIRVLADQSIRYTPQAGFDGVDSFTYTVGDGQGAAGTANVTVTVTLANLPPVAVADRATTVEDQPVTVDALANDNDPEGGPLNLTGMTLPPHGSLALTPDQAFVYTPDAGFVGEDSFTYQVRDAEGATATATVTVDVARENSPPAAVVDLATSAGTPVTVDPLANDSDPDGDPLRLTALTLPIKGGIALEPDGRRVTYTPPAGFSGTDSFTYQVSDGTAVSEAEVRVTVTAPAIPTYANGYRQRRRIVAPPQATAAEVAADFVLLVREAGAWLKPVANGGKVQHPQGFDLRFELENGTKLDHEVERYDAGAGSLIAWVRIPSWQLASQLRLFLYYGKPGLAATEANPTGTWRGYLAVLDARTGADRTGANRGLTPTNVAAGQLIGDAGAYGGNSVATRTDATFLSGLAALTVQAVTVPDASMVGTSRGIVAQGPMNGTDAAAGIALQYLAQSADGTANVVYFKVNCADGAAFVVSAANAQRAARQSLHGVWEQGAPARLFVDGVEVDASAASVARGGLTAMPSGGLYLGAGARDPATGGWRGTLDEVRFSAGALSPARIAAEAANLAATQALYGIGGEDAASQGDAAPVAVPVQVNATSGSSSDIDVAAKAYDPDGPGLPEVVAAGTPANGLVTVVSGKIRYTPFAGFVGPDAFSYTLDNAGKRSASNVFVTVRAPSSTVPKYPLAATRTLRVPEAYGTLALAYAAAQPGDHISLADGSYPGNFTFNRSFAEPGIVIKGRTVANSRDPACVMRGKYTVPGSGHWFHHLRFSYAGTADDSVASTSSFEGHPFVVSGARNTWTRNWFTIPKGIQLNRGSGSHTNRICYNRWTTTLNDGNSWISIQNGQMRPADNWHHDTLIARNYLRQHTTATYANSYMIHIGNAHAEPGDYWLFRQFKIEHNLLIRSGSAGYDKSVYLKTGVQSFSYNTIIGPAAFIYRHGSLRYTIPADGQTNSTTTCPQWHGNWIEGGASIELNGAGWDIRGNRIDMNQGFNLKNGYQMDNQYEAQYQACSDALLVGNHVLTSGSNRPYTIGHVSSLLRYDGTQGHKVRNVQIWGHSGKTVNGLNSLFYDAAQVETTTCSFSTGYGSHPVPTPAVKLDETQVGFEVTGQNGTA